MPTLRAMEASVLNDTVPDLTLILDAPPSELISRRADRGQPLDAFEARPQDFHDAVRAAFLKIADSDPARYVVLDALAPADSVLEDAWRAVSERLAGLQVN